jgi:hypothetical protein
MKKIMNDFKKIFIENKSLIMTVSLLTALLAFYFIVWHVTILTFGSFYSVLDVSGSFLKRGASYLALSALLSSVLCAILLVVRPLARKIIIGIFMVLFVGSEFIRMIDWGALYFGGAHIDSNFWTHAFYSDGMVFLFTKESMMLYASVILFFIAMLHILKKMYAYTSKGI